MRHQIFLKALVPFFVLSLLVFWLFTLNRQYGGGPTVVVEEINSQQPRPPSFSVPSTLYSLPSTPVLQPQPPPSTPPVQPPPSPTLPNTSNQQPPPPPPTTKSIKETNIDDSGDDDLLVQKDKQNYYSGVYCLHNFANSDKYKSCFFENLCYSRGKYYYFANPNKNLDFPVSFNMEGFESEHMEPGKTIMIRGLEARTNGDNPERTKLFIDVIDGNVQEHIDKNKMTKIKWVEKRSVLLKRHRCSNAGHCLFEAFYPAYALLRTFYDVNPIAENSLFRDNYLVFAEEEDEECDCGRDPLTCGTDDAKLETRKMYCKKMMSMYTQIVTDHPAQIMRKVNADNDMTCFKSIVMGSTIYGLFGDVGWRNVGGMVSEFKDLAYKRFGLAKLSHRKKLESKALHISIYVKKGMRDYLRSIHDVPKLLELVKKEFSIYTHRETEITFDISTTTISFDDMDALEQLNTMYNTDIFISPFGSASFKSVFMNKGAVLIGFPNGYGTKKGPDRASEHELFHSHMFYQNLVYPLQDDEVLMTKDPYVGNYNWKWEKMKVLIEKAINMRVKYLMATIDNVEK